MKNLIIIWGLLDFGILASYFLNHLRHGTIPFYSDMQSLIDTVASFGSIFPAVVTGFSFLLWLTLPYSGYLLCKQKPFASKVVYAQTPFRLTTLLPPSIFFIGAGLKHLFDGFSLVASIFMFSIVLFSESLKVFTVYKWRKEL